MSQSDLLTDDRSTSLGRAIDVAVRISRDPAALVETIRKEMRSINPDVPLFHVRTLEQATGLSSPRGS
jgi:hypothetical protein